MIPEKSDYAKILPHFPSVDFAFAYGSGAIQQRGYDYSSSDGGCDVTSSSSSSSLTELPMIDVIFAVTDPIQWHIENALKNPDHYTCSFNVHWLVKQVQGKDAGGPGLWFNVDVPMDTLGFPGRRMKYGIVSVGHLLEDLRAWRCLYIAGRLHKPLHIIQHHADIMTATQSNRETQLYTTIAGLSYMGDQRMLVGAENPNKVDNLVLSKVPAFRTLYKTPMESVMSAVGLTTWEDDTGDVHYSQDTTYFDNIPDDYFPSHLLSIMTLNAPDHIDISGSRSTRINANINTNINNNGTSTSTSSNKAPVSISSVNKQLSAATAIQRSKWIQSAVRHIVSRASGRQTLVNLACVGVGKGFSYVLAKVVKGIKSAK